MMLMFNRMWKHLRIVAPAAALGLLLSAAVCCGQSAPPTLGPNTVYGRLGGGTSGPGQAIPFATLLAQLESTAGGTFISAGANAPVGGLPLYAAPTATGSGNCLSSGNACTLATACSFVKQIATFLGQAGPINLADGSGGSYANATSGALCNVQGNGGGSSSQLVSINGDTVTPTNVVLQVPSGAGGFIVQDGGEISIGNLEITAVNGAGPGIQARQLAICDYHGITWGAWGNSGAHVSVTGGASCNPGNETIAANGVEHWGVSDGGHLNANGTTTIPTAVAFSNVFLQATNSNVDLSAWTVTGSGVAGTTGQRASLVGLGYLTTPGNAACNSVLPGSANCSFTQGYQSSNASDGMTGTGIMVGQQAPTITDPTITAHTFAGLPGSPTAGQISHIIDGLAGACSDSVCTTPGAAVTGGGGSLDLLMGFDGVSWRIFRAQAVPSLSKLTGQISLSSAVTGTLPIANNCPGSSGATAGTFLRGDCVWASANGTGAMTYLCTITASNSASLNNASPTSGTCPINNTYTSYELIFQNIIPATDSKIFEFQVHSASGGASYKNSGYAYSLTLNGGGSTGLANSGSATYIPLSNPADSNNASLHNAAPGYSGQIFMTNPSATGICSVYGQLAYIGAGGATYYIIGQTYGAWTTSAAVDGFQVLMDSGNLTSGSIIVYGIQ
jgi:hypothetical protein